MDSHVKSVSTDRRSTNRLRFVSSKAKTKGASADVYRRYKRRFGVTTAATREEHVHYPKSAKRLKSSIALNMQGNLQKLIHDDGTEPEMDELDNTGSTFCSELEIAMDRNGSDTFKQFYREVWILSRSLPEVLHHSSKIIDLLNKYMLTTTSSYKVEGIEVQTTQASSSFTNTNTPEQHRTINHATTDILHLYSVLARDLRHEIHPFLHSKVIPRIVNDLLNSAASGSQNKSQSEPIAVPIVEAAFRTLSYIFRYNSIEILSDAESDGREPCLEAMRQYYGTTLAHRRELVRRLAAQTFAPMIRKLKSDKARVRHLRRVLRALVAWSSAHRSQASSPVVHKLESDAVEGISLLLAEVACGVSGRLHSKGALIIKCVLDCVSGENHVTMVNNVDLIEGGVLLRTASGFLSRLCQHLRASEAADVLVSILRATQKQISVNFAENREIDRAAHSYDQSNLVILLDQILAFNDCVLLKENKTAPRELGLLLSDCLAIDKFSLFPVRLQAALAGILFFWWTCRLESAPSISSVIDGHIVSILVDEFMRNDRTHRTLTHALLNRILPSMSVEDGMGTVGKIALVAAAEINRTDKRGSLALINSLASSRFRLQGSLSEPQDDSDDIFFPERGQYCQTTDDHQNRFLEACQIELQIADFSSENIPFIAVAIRAASFLLFIDGAQEKHLDTHLKLATTLLPLMKLVVDQHETDHASLTAIESRGLASLLIEYFTCVCRAFARSSMSNDANGLVKKSRRLAERTLLKYPSSILVLKSCALYIKAIGIFGDADIILEALCPNLTSPNHFLRLHTIDILASYPAKPYIVNHADLDLQGDLDEDPSPMSTAEGYGGKSFPSGLCTVVQTLLNIESTPVDPRTERVLTSLISRVEVLARTGRMPIAYVELAASQMLGLLHVKFSPMWPAAVRAIVAMANGHESVLWPSFYEALVKAMDSNSSSTETLVPAQSLLLATTWDPLSPQSIRTQWEWEHSDSVRFHLFKDDIADAKEHGRVSRHETTDAVTMLKYLWSILESAPHLLVCHSRSLVPIVLSFLHFQYFATRPDDPDVRELNLAEHVESVPMNYRRKEIVGRTNPSILLSILKAFSSVKGPKQLFKNDVLFSIFVSFLSHQDCSVAQKAFDCVLRYKPAYLIPYSDSLRRFFLKGNMREAMLQFLSREENGNIASEHRTPLIRCLSRMMFGLLSAKSGSVKNSKDTPASRRSAILSFMSTFCHSSDEIFPFVYMAVRPYVQLATVKSVDLHHAGEWSAVWQQISIVSSDDCRRLPPRVHQGFLLTLEAMVAHLGHKVVSLGPTFMTILLAICKATEVSLRGNMDLSESSVEEMSKAPAQDRLSTVRGLCFRRLSQVLEKFCDVCDFQGFADSFWQAIESSLKLLPAMAAHADKTPALLVLLEALSRKTPLSTFLQSNAEAVPTVLKCLSPSCGTAVLETTLTFVENLLGDPTVDSLRQARPDPTRISTSLIQDNVGLLLRQFHLRIDATSKLTTSKFMSRATGRELAVLCRVGIFVEEDIHGANENVESLCSLLVPFLNHTMVTTHNDKVNILTTLSSMVDKLDAVSAKQHYIALAQVLGPFRSTLGLESKEVRKLVAQVLDKIASSSYIAAKPVTNVLLDMSALNEKKIAEIDHDKVILALSNLYDPSNPGSWRSISEVTQASGPSILLPLVYSCFYYLYNDDGVVSRGAFRALKEIVVYATETSQRTECANASEPWVKFVEGHIVPLARSGLGCKEQSLRRFFLLIISELARSCSQSSAPNLHGDLSCLVHDDEPDLDFFQNITHVQIHRRSRALQRLRKILAAEKDAPEPIFSSQSLSLVLLPISLHPVYESKSKQEEAFAIEAIATVGAICRLLSWSKYNKTLSTVLNQFHRHPEQEIYLVGLVCSIIDNFHFDVDESCDPDGISGSTSSVVRSLENRLFPKLESLLFKEKLDEKGSTTKMLRPSIVLAIMKLIRKLSQNCFQQNVTRLLGIICDALRNKDSNARDLARSTLAKIAIEMGVSYIADIVRELAITLTSGYMLHVRSAALHSVLLELSKHYSPILTDDEAVALRPFDAAVPAFIDLIQQDLFGEAQERKDADESFVRHVKEAAGSKSTHSLELIAMMILFKGPSVVTTGVDEVSSPLHALLLPFLERLRRPGAQSRILRRVKDCLLHISTGLQKNPTVRIEYVLPFVYHTISPFIGKHEVESVVESVEWNEDDQIFETIKVSGSADHKDSRSAPKSAHGHVVEWLPSTLKASRTAKAAQANKVKSTVDLILVRDGANAPKLTGSNRHAVAIDTVSVNDPASVSAVTFGLHLLSASLRKAPECSIDHGMLDPFVYLLTTAVCRSRDSEVVLLSMKCLGSLIKSNLPSLMHCSTALAGKALELLTTSGAMSSQNQDVLQACFRLLTFLLNYNHTEHDKGNIEQTNRSFKKDGDTIERALPLDEEQMAILLSFVRESLTGSDQHHPAVGLLKAIMSRHYVSAELYDLMDTLLELTVRSSKASLRSQSASIFLLFLLNYPLSEDRLEQHLRQVILNLKYEHVDGRLSAISLMTSLIDKFPDQLVEKYCQLLYLPLTLQLVNDDSNQCREAVATCISKLLQRLTADALLSLFDYTDRWSKGDDLVLCRLALQLYGIFATARVDFLTRNDRIVRMMTRAEHLMAGQGNSDWQVLYFALVMIEKIGTSSVYTNLSRMTSLWVQITSCMTNAHPWVRLASTRLVTNHIVDLDPTSFADNNGRVARTFLLDIPGSLYEVARKLCFQIGSDDDALSDELIPLIVKSLTWIVQAMAQYPALCYAESHDAMDDHGRNPVAWVMTRLASLAKPRATKRRQVIFKCYAALATYCIGCISNHLDLMLTSLYRSEVEAASRLDPSGGAVPQDFPAEDQQECQLAKDVINLLEIKFEESHEKFLRVYAAVKKRMQKRKEERKLASRTEAVVDQTTAATRRIQKHEREKKRRKRRADEHRTSRGALSSKRRQLEEP